MISRIPVLMPSKSPVTGWRAYQSQILSDEEFEFQKAHYRTNAEAQICGRISNNLEVIDIDEKHQPGISAAFLNAIRQVMPELFPRLHIVRTPSSGHHIKYHCPEATIPGNKKLAYAENAKEASIETRGEGGYVVAPPTDGYTITNNNTIPTITESDRAGLWAIAQSFNTRVKIERPKTNRKQVDNYDLTPWDAFNESDAGEGMLDVFGWKFINENNQYAYYTRPGKDKGISASFVKSKRFFYVFTSSSDLEPSRGYSPASLLIKWNHNGDGKAAFRWLVENGYGRMKPEQARKAAQYAVEAGKELPKTLPPDIMAAAVAEVTERVEKYPFGVFWEPEDRGGYRINLEVLLRVAYGLGYRNFRDNVHQIDGIWLAAREEGEFIDGLKSYIKEEEDQIYVKVCDAFERLMKDKVRYLAGRLTKVEREDIDRDTRDICRKFYENGVLTITREGYELTPYAEYTGKLVTQDRRMGRDFRRGDAGKYVQFLGLATDFVFNPRPILLTLGFLAHDFKNAATGYFIGITDECEDPMKGGGSGKSLFCSLLGHTTTYISKNAAQIKEFDSRFFQSWTGQKIFCISDLPKDFDVTPLKEMATGSFTYKRLHKNEVEVSAEDAPKIIFNSNYGVVVRDGGVGRRLIQIEFNDFFTLRGGVDKYFGGCHFPDDWDEEDWAGFDTTIADGIQLWLSEGLKLEKPKLSNTGGDKLFVQQFGRVAAGLIEENWEEFLRLGDVNNEHFRRICDAYYRDNDVHHRPSMFQLNAALEAYAARHGAIYEKSCMVNGVRVKRFRVK